MFGSLFAPRSSSAAGSQPVVAPNGETVLGAGKPVTLLVIQVDDYDWPVIFQGATLADGRAVRVVQAGWGDITVQADTYSKIPICVNVNKTAPSASTSTGTRGSSDSKRPSAFTIQPDFVLVRNEVRMPHFDGRSLLNGLIFADVPSVNSLESILLHCERPVMQGYLHRLQRRLGQDVFPVMPQHFCSSSRSLFYGYTFPAVVKIGSAHAGLGKMKITDHKQMSDFRSVLAMMPDEHCLVEPFVVGSCDLRIQKIGRHYRAFRRIDVSGEWKTNTGTSQMEETDVLDRWRRWVDEAAKMFGGLEIFAVDAIVEEGTGAEYILEVNGTSIGLHPDCSEEDNVHIRELVLESMNHALCPVIESGA